MSVIPYLEYHKQSSDAGDIDPAFDALVYLCDRFELNTEQRYWLAFLYGLCYSVPTVFYIYNEFPDFENVDVDRLQRWWDANGRKCLFQTDRLRIKTQNLVVPTFVSYRSLIGKTTQQRAWEWSAGTNDPEQAYMAAYQHWSHIKNFGRFTMFNYLQAVNVLTGFNMEPDWLDLDNAESCRNGLAFAVERLDLMNHDNDRRLSMAERRWLQQALDKTAADAFAVSQPRHKSLWSVETTLCAYKKYRRDQRWVGYYIDRMGVEIAKMQAAVPDGVCWDVLWQFRAETYKPTQLWEVTTKTPPRLPR